MRLYAIGYTLHYPGQDHSSLYEAIKKIGPYQQVTTSLWLVATTQLAEEIGNTLRREMDQNDELVVILASNYDYCWYSDAIKQWVREVLGEH